MTKWLFGDVGMKMKNENSLSIRNLAHNLTMAQKLGLGFGVVIVALVIVFLSFMIANITEEAGGDEEQIEEIPEVVESVAQLEEDGYIVTIDTVTNEEGTTVITGTKEDEWGNVTTINPNLVTTYFPYQVAREHEGYDSTLRYYLNIDEENDKVIRAMIEDCDVEGDTALVQQYINSIPIDMSGYTVEYQTFSTDSDCGE